MYSMSRQNIEPLSREDTARFNEELSGWTISLDNNHVTKDFVFETFEQSIDFNQQSSFCCVGRGSSP